MPSAIVLGKGDLAIKVAKWFRANNWDLKGVVRVAVEPAWTSSLANWAWRNNIPWWVRHEDAESADLAVSVFYERRLDETFISRYTKVWNIHNAPLPRYRGVRPVNWALKNGEPMHGVTIHEVAPTFDTGPIVAQVTFSIYPDLEEVRDVYRRCLEYGWALFRHTAPHWRDIVPRPQTGAGSYYTLGDAARLEDRRDWTRDSSR